MLAVTATVMVDVRLVALFAVASFGWIVVARAVLLLRSCVSNKPASSCIKQRKAVLSRVFGLGTQVVQERALCLLSLAGSVEGEIETHVRVT